MKEQDKLSEKPRVQLAWLLKQPDINIRLESDVTTAATPTVLALMNVAMGAVIILEYPGRQVRIPVRNLSKASASDGEFDAVLSRDGMPDMDITVLTEQPAERPVVHSAVAEKPAKAPDHQAILSPILKERATKLGWVR